jgi:hypothetical protein
MPISITHPEHGEARCGDWQVAEFEALGWTRKGAATAPATADPFAALGTRCANDLRAHGFHSVADVLEAVETEEGREALIAVHGLNESNLAAKLSLLEG